MELQAHDQGFPYFPITHVESVTSLGEALK